MQYSWCSYKRLGHRHTQRADHVKAQGENGYVQAEGQGLTRNQLCQLLIWDSNSPIYGALLWQPWHNSRDSNVKQVPTCHLWAMSTPLSLALCTCTTLSQLTSHFIYLSGFRECELLTPCQARAPEPTRPPIAAVDVTTESSQLSLLHRIAIS